VRVAALFGTDKSLHRQVECALAGERAAAAG
jgi:hypothetical protein